MDAQKWHVQGPQQVKYYWLLMSGQYGNHKLSTQDCEQIDSRVPSSNFPLRLRTHENGCFWYRILFWRNSRSSSRNQWTALLQKPLSRAVYGPVFTNPDASPFPSVVQIIRNNQINLGGCKNFNQSAPQGQILTLLLAWEWDFNSKRNWGISLPHRIVFGAAASCSCPLSRVENVQEKPLRQGKA